MNPLHEHMTKLFAECVELSVAKNHDYAGDGDPLRNFRKAEEIGISMPQGIMVRLTDKWARLEGFMKTGDLKVSGEKIKDTMMDIINYVAILSYALSQADPENWGDSPVDNFMKEVLEKPNAFIKKAAGAKWFADEMSEISKSNSATLDDLNAATRAVLKHQNDIFGPGTPTTGPNDVVSREQERMLGIDDKDAPIMDVKAELAKMGVPVNNVEKCKKLIEDSYQDAPKVLSTYEEWLEAQRLHPSEYALDSWERYQRECREYCAGQPDRPGGEE